MMHYKGFKGGHTVINGGHVGMLQGVNGLVTYTSDSLEGLKVEFEKAVDDFLEFCAEEGMTPEEFSNNPKSYYNSW